jgi:acyl-CoA thioester hydrolase
MTAQSLEDLPDNPIVPRQHVTEIRVRYQETDAQGRIHHANYLNYFEIGRVEMLRAAGVSYRKLEESGIMLVVAAVRCNYHVAARYDDLLRLTTSVVKAKGVRIQHRYEIHHGEELVCDGETTVAAVNPQGKVVRLPKWLQMDKKIDE